MLFDPALDNAWMASDQDRMPRMRDRHPFGHRSSSSSSWWLPIVIASSAAVLGGALCWFMRQRSSKLDKPSVDRTIGQSSSDLAYSSIDPTSVDDTRETTRSDALDTRSSAAEDPSREDKIGRIIIDKNLRQPYTTRVDWVEYKGPPLVSEAVLEEMDVHVAANQSVEEAIFKGLLERDQHMRVKMDQDQENARGPCPENYRYLPAVSEAYKGQCIQEAPEGYELVLWQPPGESSTLWYHRAVCQKGMEKNRDECKNHTMNSQVYYEDTWKVNYWCNNRRPFVGGICRESKNQPGIVYPVDRCPYGFYATGKYCAKCTELDYVLKGGGDQRPYCASKCPLGSEDRNDTNSATCWKKYQLAPIVTV